MAELSNEDSYDGVLIIDERNDDSITIEISDDSDVDVEEIDNDINNISSSIFIPSSSINKVIGSACKKCSGIFRTNNDLLNHTRKFKGHCLKINNESSTNKRKKAEDETPSKFEVIPQHNNTVKKKRERPPTIITDIKPSVSEAIILHSQAVSIPTYYEPIPSTYNTLPLLSQMLIDEIEPEYPCDICGQVFRHNIGLICHLNSEHNNSSSTEAIQKKRKPTKLEEKKNIKDKNQTDNDEPVDNTVDLTLLPDFKKDSLFNRMKSYVYSAKKDQVICVLCKMEFKNTKKALAHVEDKHIMDKLECGYCNMKFVYELKLRSHMAKRHKIIVVYKCDKCLKYINKEEYEMHPKECKEKVKTVKTEIKEIKGDNN